MSAEPPEEVEDWTPRFTSVSTPGPDWRSVAFAVFVFFVVGGIVLAVGYAILDTHSHNRLAAQLCREIPIVRSEEFAADLHRLHDGPTHERAYAYRADLLQYGPDALVTQKAFDALARQCARD